MPDAIWALVVVLLGGLALGVVVLLAGREAELARLRSQLAAVREEGATAAGIPREATARLEPADELGIGLVWIDGGRIRLANGTAHRMLRAGPGTLAGRTAMEAFIDHRLEELTRRAQREGSARGEYLLGGEPEVTLAFHAWRDERLGGVWAALVDVSELHRLRRIRAEFIDNLAHELRTPLTTVRLLTESLAMEAERVDLPPRVRASISKIDVETGHLAQMVNELLDLAKIEQGEGALRRAELDLGPLVEDTLERLRLYAERQGVTLRGEMPGAAADRTVNGDADRLGQLLVNVVHNAIKFSPDGGEVVVRVTAGPDDVVLAVEDRGVGIPRRDLERIFERFYKADRARVRGAGGTGLGLSIARHIAERHGGRIWAESEEGRGSRFFVSLPRGGGSDPQAEG